MTAWALRRACALTRLERLPWVPEALEAMQQGQVMPGPFRDRERVVSLLEQEPLLRSLKRRPGMTAVFEAAQQTIGALADVAVLDRLDAALGAVAAVHAAAVAAGMDGQEVLLQVREQLKL